MFIGCSYNKSQKSGKGLYLRSVLRIDKMLWFSKKQNKIEKGLESLDKNVKTSFENIKQDMVSLGKWMGDFSKKNYEQEKGIENLEKRMVELWGKIEHIERSNDRSIERSNSLNSQTGSIEAIKPEYKDVFTHVQSFNRSVQSFMNVQERNNFEILTPAQKRVVALMAFAGGPLGYEEISKKLGINEVTARRHINDIKRAGVSVKAKMSANSRKSMFYLDEKVRNSLVNLESEAKKGDSSDKE